MNLTMPIVSRPPRRVPVSTRLVVALGHPLALLGWIFTAFGAACVPLFVMNADLSSWREFRGPLESVSGVITASEQTRASVGGSKGRKGTPVFAHHYAFELHGRRYHGVSYRTGGGLLPPGARVTVEFVPGRPELSRIRGMRRALFGPGAALAIVFPLAGVGLLVATWFRGRKHLRLLVHGEIAPGRLVNKEETPYRVNKQPVYKLTFEFTDWRGEPQRVVVQTEQVARLEDEPYERLFYDPQQPSRAVLMDALPGNVRFGPDGELQPAGWWRGALTLLPPALTLGLWIALLVLKPLG
jgi:hypothetical protein